MIRILGHAVAILALTVLTQIGGLAWAVALLFRRRMVAFCAIYAALTVAATEIAPHFGRTALSCWDRGPLQVQSWLYCAMNRTYVTPEMTAVLADTAEAVDRRYPGAITLVLDGSFPFLVGFPLLPHLSHDDGEKVDLAFYYADDTGYLPGATRSPIAYFAFEKGPTACPSAPARHPWASLRWDLAPLQPLWRDLAVEPARTRYLLQTLARDARVGKILLEPHLKSRLGLTDPKIRFQGCRAARHDDHIHLQL